MLDQLKVIPIYSPFIITLLCGLLLLFRLRRIVLYVCLVVPVLIVARLLPLLPDNLNIAL